MINLDGCHYTCCATHQREGAAGLVPGTIVYASVLLDDTRKAGFAGGIVHPDCIGRAVTTDLPTADTLAAWLLEVDRLASRHDRALAILEKMRGGAR